MVNHVLDGVEILLIVLVLYIQYRWVVDLQKRVKVLEDWRAEKLAAEAVKKAAIERLKIGAAIQPGLGKIQVVPEDPGVPESLLMRRRDLVEAVQRAHRVFAGEGTQKAEHELEDARVALKIFDTIHPKVAGNAAAMSQAAPAASKSEASD